MQNFIKTISTNIFEKSYFVTIGKKDTQGHACTSMHTRKKKPMV